MIEKPAALITNDAVVLGILITILGLIFITSSSEKPFFKKFYSIVPSVLLCYFIPAIFNTFNIISGETSNLYTIASRYLLPASLVLLTLSINFVALKKLGSKAVIMFLAGTAGIIIGGPIALYIVGSFYPEVALSNGEEVWKGLATIAGSWIGGGANQTAMLEVFGASKSLFAQMIAVDVLVANIWMGFLLYGAQKTDKINKWLKADNSPIIELEKNLEEEQSGKRKQLETNSLMVILMVAFGFTGIGHFLADILAPFFKLNYPELEKYSFSNPFFWLVIITTTAGVLLSFTKARKIESYGASKVGTVFLYILVATIGTHMDLAAIFNNPLLFVVGGIWITIHILVMIVVARIIKAPFFYVAVGSQANIGGAASAPIVAAAFSPFLAPVGVLLAVLGYALGTYGAYICGLILYEVFKIIS
ncbi:DUF819 domain-containing protein [Flavobacterium sp. K5-23]|uniref:DUF819 family protein n=1 Tax=Flavobacterium sp. K5-23 TaxID=2746225 RepID=UPI00200DBA4C|nr:DUF819 family protein [Flavobacterium sp. K5-23]UQD55825.1 DUF819 family protein [Flavobacterium sp. K5-23]